MQDHEVTSKKNKPQKKGRYPKKGQNWFAFKAKSSGISKKIREKMSQEKKKRKKRKKKKKKGKGRERRNRMKKEKENE